MHTGILMLMMRTLGGYIRDYLDRTGLSQTELATRAGVPRVTINRLVKEKTALPDADTRRKLASAMGVSHLDIIVAAGEIEPEEVASAGAEGVVERSAAPPEIHDVLRNLDWSNPTVVTRALVMLQTIQDTQRPGATRLHDPNETERRADANEESKG